MAVRPSTLENPERDLRLATRGPIAPIAEEEPRHAAPAEELRTIRERIEAARKLRPQAKDLHCADCFGRGRDAAIRLIEGDKGA